MGFLCLCLGLFYVFKNGLDEGLDRMVIKSADDTKLGGVSHALEQEFLTRGIHISWGYGNQVMGAQDSGSEQFKKLLFG